MSPNYSLYGLAIYWILSFVPQVIGVSSIRKASQGRFNNANPRSSAYHEDLQKRIPKADYARVERAKAAHTNSLESFGLVAAALIGGSAAGLDSDSLNTTAGLLIASRAVYIVLYINTTNVRYSYARSLVWFANQAVALTVLIRAASVFATASTNK